MRTPEKLTATEKEQLAFLKGVHPTLEAAYDLVQAFLDMVHNRTGGKLDAWLNQIRTSQIPELIRFGKGIERDKAPVRAALQLSYSNGVVEGHVHCLKLIKRQGYGRASFPLLRQRALYQAV
jgi:transposase